MLALLAGLLAEARLAAVDLFALLVLLAFWPFLGALLLGGVLRLGAELRLLDELLRTVEDTKFLLGVIC